MIKHLALVAALAGPMRAGRGGAGSGPAPRRAIPRRLCGSGSGRRRRCRRPARPRWSGRSRRASRRRATSRSSSPDLPVLHPAQGAAGRREGVWVPYDDSSREIDPRRLPPAVEHELPRQPVDRDVRTTPSERRDRQDRHLPHGGAAAGQDRRLLGSKKVETSKIDEKLKELNAEIRLDTFIDPALMQEGRGHRPRHDEGEGLPVRRGHARDRGVAGGPKLVNLTSTWTRGRRSRSGTSTSSATRRSATATLQKQMKENKEQLVPVLDHRPRHLPGEPSSRKTPSGCVEYYRDQRLHPGAGRRARD